MTPDQVKQPIRERIEAAALALPIAWPAVPSKGDRPRVELAWTTPDRRDGTVALEAPIQSGRAILTAVTDADAGETPADAIVAQLQTAFPDGLNLSGPGVLIVIGTTVPREGYRDGPEWRAGLTVPYIAYPRP